MFQLDVKSAFLNGKLKEKVFIREPKEEKEYRLKKALYGLHQAPHGWYSKINTYFVKNGFCRNESKPTLYRKMQGDKLQLLVCLYVEDIIFMGSSQSTLDKFKASMRNAF